MCKNTEDQTLQNDTCALHAGYQRLQIHVHTITQTAFPLQKWLLERVSMLLYTYNVCLVYK